MPAPAELSYNLLVYPTVLALRRRNGISTIEQLEEDVARLLSLSSEVLAAPSTNPKDPRTEFQYRLAWVRTYLKNVGALTNDANANWSLTEYGAGMSETEALDVFRTVRAEQRRRRKARELTLEANIDEVTSRLATARKRLSATVDAVHSMLPPQYAGQRPATYRFAIQAGKLTAQIFNAAITERDAAALYEQLKISATDLAAAANGANSPITALIGKRAGDLLRTLGASAAEISAGDLLALWSTFNAFVALLSTSEGESETTLIVRHLANEVLQRLSALASLSHSVREVVAYRNALALDEQSARDFDLLQHELAEIASLDTFGDIVDNSVLDALASHEGRKRDAVATAENTTDIDVKAKAAQDATDIRKLQALDASNLASGLAEAVAATPLPPRAGWKDAWLRFNQRLERRIPDELADALVDMSVTTLKSTPALAFALLGAMAQPVYGALLGLAPALFGAPTKRLKEVLPPADSTDSDV